MRVHEIRGQWYCPATAEHGDVVVNRDEEGACLLRVFQACLYGDMVCINNSPGCRVNGSWEEEVPAWARRALAEAGTPLVAG